MKRLKRRALFFLSIMGPGIITASAGNDAGGVATYSLVGATFGYRMLWLLFLMTFCLAIVQEMGTRMGAVTGKGLSGLIREEFGVRLTILAVLALLVANAACTIAEFAGIAASLQLMGISKYLSVPLMALVVWVVVLRVSYKGLEKVFLGLCLVYFTYIVSAFLVHPPWTEVLKHTFVPTFNLQSHYILILIAFIGTTITPWMQFYVQSSVVDKGISPEEYRYERLDVIGGALFANLIAFFIIICCAATLFNQGIRIETAQDAALALKPLAGEYCSLLFALGLFGASMLAAGVLPLSTAYAVCESFGWESGLSKTLKEAPFFYILYTLLILISAGVVLFPKIPLIWVMLLSQDINGILLPVILIFMLLLINNKRIMGRYTNSRLYNIIVIALVGFIIILTILLLAGSWGGILKT
ncbi:MAG: Mn transporter [Armatimonadetes bacterium CG07_land_8_20_14_0_80_40_9]|nr:MAG: Mn transporter [Armatimonadetes bacterium CG07_land_8_20_14_0_80_40_9]